MDPDGKKMLIARAVLMGANSLTISSIIFFFIKMGNPDIANVHRTTDMTGNLSPGPMKLASFVAFLKIIWAKQQQISEIFL